jgi:hypothetical protein
MVRPVGSCTGLFEAGVLGSVFGLRLEDGRGLVVSATSETSDLVVGWGYPVSGDFESSEIS